MNKLLYRTTGRFYLGESSEQAQYVFQLREDAPKEIKRSFLVDMAKDGEFSGSAYDVAWEIKRVIDSYWINTDQPRIQALVEYLEKWLEKDEYDGLKERRERLTKELEDVEKELGGYDPEEWENWTPEITVPSESA